MSKLEIYSYIFEKRYTALFLKMFSTTFKSAFTGFCKGIKDVFVYLFCEILNIICLLLWFIIIPYWHIQSKKIKKNKEYQRYAKMWSEKKEYEENASR